MKSGASDPFASTETETEGDEPDDDSEDRAAETTTDAGTASPDDEHQSSADEATVNGTRDGSDRDSPSATDAPPTAESRTDGPTAADAEAALEDLESVEAESGDDDADGLPRDQLPLVLRRDRVKDERPEVHQLFVQRETHDEAIDAERDLQDRLDDDLSRTDAREAIYLAGMAHLDEAEATLREWGYDL